MTTAKVRSERLSARNQKDSRAWFLGIDLGTGSCKSVVVSEMGRVLGFGTGDYASRGAGNRFTELDPQSVVDGMARAVRAAIVDAEVMPSGCQALSLGSALHTLIAVDRKGEPLTGIFTWADGRGSQQAQSVRLESLAKEIYHRSGCPPSNIYPLYKVLWLRENKPEIIQKTDSYFSVKDYVLRKLTGMRLLDYNVAAGSGMLNTHTLLWDSLSLNLAGIEPAQLSPLASPMTTTQGIDPAMAEILGIPASTVVVLGSSDAFNSTLGAGAIHPGQATCMVGTSGALRIVTPQPFVDEAARTWCYAVDRDRWLVGGAINNGGITLSWLQDMLNSAARDGKQISFDELVELAGESPAGASGLVCLPFFTGERSPNWNGDARAVFFGLTLEHDVRHLARCLLEGVAYRLRSISEILVELAGDVREIRASGGYARSALWPQIISNVIGRELLTPQWPETSSLGAAFWAMLGAGVYGSIEEAADQVRTADRFVPVADDTVLYDRLYQIYNDLYRQLEASFSEIARLQRELSG